MKKLHSLFILSILALTMFVGCQMPTDGTGNGAEAVETEYNITIVAPHGTVELDKTKAKAGETVRILKYIADEGYRFKSVNAYKDDNTLVEPNPDHTSFVMPSCNVKIVAEYEVIPNDDDTPTVADFVDTTDYDVYKDGNFLATIKGEVLNAICKKEGFVKNTDYTIEGNKVTVITGSRLYDWLSDGDNVEEIVSGGEGGNGNGGSGTGTPTETYKVSHGQDSGNYSLVFYNYKTGYTKGETVTFLIKNGDATPKAEELYLVKTYVTDADNNAVEVTYNKENHTVSFTMPDKDVMVRADFEDVVCRAVNVGAGDSDNFPNWFNVTTSNVDTDFQVALRFGTKEYDNLEEFDDDIYKFKLCNLRDIYKNPENYKSGSNYLYYFYIQLGKDCNVYENAENYKYHENPVVIYKGEIKEPKSNSSGSRYVNLDNELKNQK